jgi:hypothetical protein
MNLREIIRESINSVLLDSIISEEITNAINPPQEKSPEEAQGGYGYTNSGFEDAGHNAPAENQPKAANSTQGTNANKQNAQATQQGQQQPAVDFSQYADALRKIVGASGIDPAPVENNQAAAQHVNNLNQFVYAVINAIDSGNINAANSAAAGGSTSSGRYSPYGKTGTDIALDGANKAATAAGKIVDTVGSVGGANNPFNGVGSAFSKAHNETNRDVANYLNQRQYINAYNNTSQGAEGGTNLVYLMQSANEGCYPRLQTEYNQINQAYNGIFSAAPNVSNCHDVLRNLADAVTKYNGSQKQSTQDTRQPAQGQQQTTNSSTAVNPANGGGNTAQPGSTATSPAQPGNTAGNPTATNGNVRNQPTLKGSGQKIKFNPKNDPNYQKPHPNYANYANELIKIDRSKNNLSSIVEKLERGGNDKNVVNLVKWIGRLSDSVVSAIQGGSYYNEDYQNTNIEPLTKIMSLDGKKVGEDGTYEMTFWHYILLNKTYDSQKKSIEFKALNSRAVMNTMQTLRFLYTRMKRDKIVDKPKKNNR